MSELITQLCQIVAKKLQDNPQTNEAELVDYLKVVIDQDPQLAAWVKTGSRILQNNQGGTTAFQTLVEGGIANIGTHVHANPETIKAAFKKLLEEFQSQSQEIPQNIPRSGSSKFVGRDPELDSLHQMLQENDRMAIAAVAGMGGVGKTELAIQYAYKHLELKTYQGGICWLLVRSQDAGSAIVNFARSSLNLTPPDDLDLLNQVKYCWRNWQDGQVLVVLDDVTDYHLVKDYLPPVGSRFKVLMTTRLDLRPSVKLLQLDVLPPEAALELLCSLAGQERIEKEPDIANQLCEWLGYLPLGLELVGRYLGKEPDLSLEKMLARLKNKRLQHKSLAESDPTMTAQLGVAAAFELSWERLNKPAQDLGCLLSLFALAPISWKEVESSAKQVASLPEDEEELEDVRRKLTELHLLQRTGEGTYRLHQLIREFLQEKLASLTEFDEFKQAFVATMVAIAKKIPSTPTQEQIQAWTPVIPHIAEVAETLSQILTDEDLIWPFVGLGKFYQGQGAYQLAEPWYKKCLDQAKARFGSEHLGVATSLNNLAGLYRDQGRYQEAEPLLQQALKMTKRLLGESHPDVATSLNNLAGLYKSQRRYQEAEPLYHKALEMRKRLLGESHPFVATSLNNLAELYRDQGQYKAAEPLHLMALEMRKRLLGESHPDVAQSLNSIARLCYDQKRYQEAELRYQEALKMRLRLLGESHPSVAQSLNGLAYLYYIQRRYEEAEPLYLQALEIMRQMRHLRGESHHDVATILNNLAELYYAQGRYEEAEPLYLKALEIMRRPQGHSHPNVATTLNTLAKLYYYLERYEEAESLFQEALKIFEQHEETTYLAISNRENLGRCRERLSGQ